MCPACIGTAALIAGTAASTGGLAALVTYFAKSSAKKIGARLQFKENHDGH
jgi:hypothetical protein